MADQVQNSLVERLILRYAGPFVEHLDLSVNLTAGEILIRNLVLRESGFFKAVEDLLVRLGIDVWGCGGLLMVFPTGVEIVGGSIKEARVQIPVPNPFNGEQWRITVDGITGKVTTLTDARKADLLRKAKRKSIEEAVKRYEREASASPTDTMAHTSSSRRLGHTKRPTGAEEEEEDDDDEEAPGEGTVAGADLWASVISGSFTRVQKRIDRYFKEHLAICFRGASLVFNILEDPEFEDLRWEVQVGECSLDLGVGEIKLPGHLHNAVQTAPCHGPTEPPAGRKVIEELVGVGFKGLRIETKTSQAAPAVFKLDFPETAFVLHIVKRQWSEHDTSCLNGVDRVHVDLPGDFSVAIQLDHKALRGSVVRALHQIYAGVSCAVPDMADWLTVPCPNGWNTDGSLVVPAETDEAALVAEYKELLAWQATQSSQQSIMEELAPEAKEGRPWFLSRCCGDSLALSAGRRRNPVEEAQLSRLAWFETVHATEWIAYWRWRSARSMAVPATAAFNDSSEMPPAMDRPTMQWKVIPWRRFEVTLVFEASFTVDLSTAANQERGGMHLEFPPGLAVSMVRSLPAEWEIWMTLPGMIGGVTGSRRPWLQLGQLSATLGWGRRDLLPKSLADDVPEEVPSVCRLQYLKLDRVAVHVTPQVVRELLPLFVEFPYVLSWPELWYFWGEWGYMPRPLGYMVGMVQLKRIRLSLEGKVVGSREASSAASTNEAELVMAIAYVVGNTAGKTVYADTVWQPWWNLDLCVGETSLTGSVFDCKHLLMSYTLVKLEVARRPVGEEHREQPLVDVGVHLNNMKLSCAPSMVQCGLTLTRAYLDSARPVLPHCLRRFWKAADMAINAAKQGGITIAWLRPMKVGMQVGALDHMEIDIQNSVTACLRIHPTFDLTMMLHDPETSADRAPLVLEMDPATVTIWCLDQSRSEAWEPLLEHWSYMLSVEAHAPPTPKLVVQLSSDHTEGPHAILSQRSANTGLDSQSGGYEVPRSLHLNISSAVVQVAKEILKAWFPTICALATGQWWKQAEAQQVPHIAALNLCPIPVCATVRNLPKDITEVVLKLQSIFRGRKIRRQAVDRMRISVRGGDREESALPDGMRSSPRKSRSRGAWNGAPTQPSIFWLSSSRPHSLVLEEKQRVALNFAAVPRQMARSTSGTQQKGSTTLRSSQRSGNSQAQRTSFWNCCRRRRDDGSSSPRGSSGMMREFSSGAGGKQVPARMEVCKEDMVFIDVCRHGYTKLVPSVDGATAYMCEVISPSVNDRMLLIQSTVRIFNYTDMVLGLGFVNAQMALTVEASVISHCTCSSHFLGKEQPVDPRPYALAGPGDASTARVFEGAWELPPCCFASIPPELRQMNGGLVFRIRGQSHPRWDSKMFSVLETKTDEVHYYEVPGAEAIRVVICRKKRRATAVVAGTGRTGYSWDVICLPCFSVASLHPLPLDVQVVAGEKEQTLTLQPGSTRNIYSGLYARLSQRKSITVKVRFAAQEGSSWSPSVTVQNTERPYKMGPSPVDQHVVLGGSSHVAPTEITIRSGDVCIISSPVWFCDKTGLALRCTDKKGREAPRAGPFFLLDTSSENHLTMGGKSSTGDSPVVQAVMSTHVHSNTTTKLMLTVETKGWSSHKVCPVSIRSQDLGQMLADHSPPLQLLTAWPGVMLWSDERVRVRQPGREEEETVVEANTHTPLWFWGTKDQQHQIRVGLGQGGACEWSGVILCNHGATGVHGFVLRRGLQPGQSHDSLGEAVLSTGEVFPTSPPGKVIRVEVSDASEGVLLITISTSSSALLLTNSAQTVQMVALETDAPGSSGGSSLKHTTSQRGPMKLLKHTVGEPGTLPPRSNSVPPHCFPCNSGSEVAAGWFEPFAKGVQTHHVRLWLCWPDPHHICGPLEVDLFSVLPYVVLRPRSWSIAPPVVITMTQGRRQYRIDVTEDAAWATGSRIQTACGNCGALLAGEHFEDTATHVHQCAKCKVELQGPREYREIREAGAMNSSSPMDAFLSKTRSMRLTANGVPVAAVAYLKDWLKLIVVDFRLNIQAVSISFLSKRRGSEGELAFLFVEDVQISMQAPEGLYATHVYQLTVFDLRCDRQIQHIGDSVSPVILACTVLQDDSSAGDTSAVSVSIVRPFVTAPAVCLKDVQVKLGVGWEVAVDTELVNALFDFGDQCAAALGNPFDLFRDSSVPPASPDAAFEVLRKLGEEQSSITHKMPRVVQVESLDIDGVHAKIWAALQPGRMAFVPVAAARFLRLLTLSDHLELKGASVHIAPVPHEPRRASAIELGKALIRAYIPQLVSVGVSVLGASNLHKFLTGVPTALSHAVVKSSDAMLSVVTLGNGAAVKTSTKRVLGMRAKPSVNSKLPSFSGWERIREPQLLLAHGRVTPYSALNAELLRRLGSDFMSNTLHIFVIAEEPSLVLVIRLDALAMCGFTTLRSAAPGGELGRRNPSAANGKIADRIFGPWTWDTIESFAIGEDGRIELALRPGGGSKPQRLFWPCPEWPCRVLEGPDLGFARSLVERMVHSNGRRTT